MKMKSNAFLMLITSAAVAMMSLVACKKDSGIVQPEPVAMFMARPAAGAYSILTPTTTFRVRVGLTTPLAQPKTVTISVTSPTGAVEGTHYTLSSKTLTFAPGAVLDSFTVQGNQSLYLAGRRDTLIFQIVGGGHEGNNHLLPQRFTLVMRGPCFEGDVDLNDFLGDFNGTLESWYGNRGPYKTTVTAVNQLTPTTGTITINDIWLDDVKSTKPLTFLLDWTNPAARTIVLSPSPQFDLGDVTDWGYAGHQAAVRHNPTFPAGTFSICNQTITINMQVGLRGPSFPTGAYFAAVYNLQMNR